LFAVEKSPMAFDTLKHNLINERSYFDWVEWLPKTHHDISDVLREYPRELSKLKGAVHLVAGGPPCQGFSLAGRRDGLDERNRLAHLYVEFIDAVRPGALFFENVMGFTMPFKAKAPVREAYSDQVSNSLKTLGYSVKSSTIDFSDFGLPQKRRRYILVGLLSGDPAEFFEEMESVKADFLASKGLRARTSLKEAISDLEKRHGEVLMAQSALFKEGAYGRPESKYQRLMRRETNADFPDSHRFANHRKRTVERFRYILRHCKKNHDIGDKVKSKFALHKNRIIPLNGDTQCPTLTTLPDDYIHYSEPRILTVREYARIQSFPDWFEFKNKYTTGGRLRRQDVPRYTQAANAVPPLFAELSGQVLKAMVRA